MNQSGFHKRKSRDLKPVELRAIIGRKGYDPLTNDVQDSTNIQSSSHETPSSPLAKELLDHVEPHFENSDIVRDIVIGLSDGLTVPFALAAGLATFDNSRLVVAAGMAEIVAGAISMGLGGYLAGHLEVEHYDAERRREEFEVETVPEKEEEEIIEIF